MSEPLITTPLRDRAQQALGDRFLHEALDIATTKFIGLRREAFGAFPQGEGLRDRARATLKEVVEDRKLRFEVEVTDGDRTVGIGTHERRTIEVGTVGRVSADEGRSESEG